jgi:hypothetical protein
MFPVKRKIYNREGNYNKNNNIKKIKQNVATKHNKRYDSSGLLGGNSWFIYKYCREWIEYAGLV